MKKLYLLLILMLIPLSSCHWVLAYLFSNKEKIEEKVEQKEEVKSHKCICDPIEDPDDDKSRLWYWCGEDNRYICCGWCHKQCSQKPTLPETKPPVPIPRPDCDLSIHCKGKKEECIIGGGDCCTKCHQPCPPWEDTK